MFFGLRTPKDTTNPRTVTIIIMKIVVMKDPLASYSLPAIVEAKDAISRFVLISEKFME